jgi:cyclopropane-fatty-acyl-phospholipid synthase
MSYTCAYWKDAKNLDEAQFAKFDLVYRKLQIPKGSKMKIADLGMGWGTLANYTHAKGSAIADVSVTGVSLSKEQVRWAKDNLARPGLDFLWMDYRSHCEDPAVQGTYDRVYSIGMLEHVGFKNHAGFFRCVKKLLKPDGLAVIHTIGEPDFVPASDPFLEKYIFPGAVIPTLSSLTSAFENDFILEDFHNFGHDYAPTLAAWNVNAEKYFKENPKAYTPEFQRMWHYYLKLCEALFELRINQLWQFVFSPRPTYRTGIERQL